MKCSICRKLAGLVLAISILIWVLSHVIGCHYSSVNNRVGIFALGILGGDLFFHSAMFTSVWIWESGFHWHAPSGDASLIDLFAGFSFTPRFDNMPSFRFYVIPLWYLIIPPAVTYYFLLRHDRRKLRMSGHCPCGYNLTGNESGTCPECGAAIATSTDVAPA